MFDVWNFDKIPCRPYESASPWLVSILFRRVKAESGVERGVGYFGKETCLT